jgi:predicted MPP superfamily phosphohydrolase
VLSAVLGVLALGIACVAYGVVIERRWYRVVRYPVPILPTEGPAELTILHLSDLHFVRRDPGKASFLSTIEQPDVCVVTGDFLAEPEAVETAVAALRPVRGRLASWFVLGSNDYYVPRPTNYLGYFRKDRQHRSAKRGRAGDLVAQLEADGWDDLTNVRSSVSLDGVAVELLGLDDAHLDRQDLTIAPRNEPDRLGVAVMHSPDSAPEAAACGYDLLVAGHTHGGQVRLPLVGALVTNCAMPRRLASGLIRMGGSWFHLSPGLGTSKYAPFRFWCRPEATLLELRRP